jgi:hypothetical protein
MDAKLMKAAGLTPKDFTMQLALYQEYFWNRLNTAHSDDFKVWLVGIDDGGRHTRTLQQPPC